VTVISITVKSNMLGQKVPEAREQRRIPTLASEYCGEHAFQSGTLEA
jgi:hypothetical protein